jgi:hypothetical protein
VKRHRALSLVGLVTVSGSLAFVALGPVAGCDGTGTTPMCDFPDGANNPEAGCGELREAAALPVDAEGTEDVETPDSSGEKVDAADASMPKEDASDAHVNAPDAHEDASDAHVLDAKSDAKG